jgi:hypothetical protein
MLTVFAGYLALRNDKHTRHNNPARFPTLLGHPLGSLDEHLKMADPRIATKKIMGDLEETHPQEILTE